MRKFFRGRREALIGWEVNGPGANLQHDFDRAQYKAVYRQRSQGTRQEAKTDRVGWMSTKRTKRVLLGGLARALAQGECVISSGDCLDEMLEYIVLEDGSIEAGSRRDESSGARESHGDRVIATAGALMLCEEGVGAPEQAPAYEEDTLGAILKHEEIMRGDQ
jgi:hypothetical protein